jgi:hypothetical protein
LREAVAAPVNGVAELHVTLTWLLLPVMDDRLVALFVAV